MSFKDFFERLIQGWFPEEPKLSKNLLKKQQMPIGSYLRLTNSLKIVYGLTLGFVSLALLSWLIVYCWEEQSPSIFSVYVAQLPSLFLINTLPLSIFVVVFLTKGGGSHYFRSWNAGKKLQFSGLAIVAGYITVMLPHLLNLQAFIPYGNVFRNPQYRLNTLIDIYSIFVIIGLGIMAVGFASLLLSYKTASPKKETGTQKTKTTKKTWFLVFVVAVLSVSLVCLTGVHLKLQSDYEGLSESHQFAIQSKACIVNEEWTDNVGVDSKYVNYKGGIINFGHQTAYNVTLLVRISGVDDTLLKKEEIFIGDIAGPFGYHAVDVNIEYSGELSHVSAGTRWD
jgi:hypothetical protein